MFVSGVGGTGKSFVIEAIKALVGSIWPSDSLTLYRPLRMRVTYCNHHRDLISTRAWQRIVCLLLLAKNGTRLYLQLFRIREKTS